MSEIDLICGDCLQVMRELPDNFINLVYADPPFFTQTIRTTAQWTKNILRKEEFSYSDNIWDTLDDYLIWMRDRIEEVHRVLKKIGSFYLHCDWRASHYLKVLCDKIFKYSNFRNEIIWCYRAGTFRPKKNFARKHDIILRYSKSDDFIFNADAVRIPMDFRGSTTVTQLDGTTKRVYANPKGKIPEDWWADIPFINSQAKERTGYPTQKPVVLLERIIKASSNKGDLALDPFIGSGTTAIVCLRLDRHCIGIDNNPDAIKLAEERIEKERSSV